MYFNRKKIFISFWKYLDKLVNRYNSFEYLYENDKTQSKTRFCVTKCSSSQFYQTSYYWNKQHFKQYQKNIFLKFSNTLLD